MSLLETIVFVSTVAGLALVVGEIALSTIRNGISPMPSSSRAAKAVIRAMKERGFEGPIYDLGSGFGTLCVALTRAFPETRVTGVENAIVPFLVSVLLKHVFACARLRLVRDDFHDVTLTDAGVVVCYLYTNGMEKLRPKLEAELADGTVVVSNTFAVRGWSPLEVVELPDLYRTKIYVYEVRRAYYSDNARNTSVPTRPK